MATKTLVQSARATEDSGEWTGYEKTLVVPVVSGGTAEEILQSALDDPSVPQPGAALNSEHPRIRVSRRIPRIVGLKPHGGPHLVSVAVEYVLIPPIGRAYSNRGTSSVAPIPTVWDRLGNPISYTYSGHQKFKEINVYHVEAVDIRDSIEQTDDPLSVSSQWINRINSDTWNGGAPRHWLCAEVQYVLFNMNIAPDLWRFTWTFRYSPLPFGWQPYITYYDMNGDIPADIATRGEGTGGFKEVDWHPAVPFSVKFPPPDEKESSAT